MKIITGEQVLAIHSRLVSQTGGTDGVREDGLLESALMSPFQTFGGMAVYDSIYAKAAQLGFSLIKNHPFLDGNKRTGVHIMLVFLALNGVELAYTQKELYSMVLSVAEGSCGWDEVADWIDRHRK